MEGLVRCPFVPVVPNACIEKDGSHPCGECEEKPQNLDVEDAQSMEYVTRLISPWTVNVSLRDWKEGNKVEDLSLIHI